MTQRGYQTDFSSMYPAMYEVQGRQRKAETLLAVLDEVLGSRLASARVVNVGCSTGIIDGFIAPHVGSHIGIDIDIAAIRYASTVHAQQNLSFLVGDAMAIDLKDASCDVVICSQVYEHVPDPKQMMSEIYRVLAPGGVCYFAATNRLSIIEQHYFLPFLSIIPVWLAHRYLQLLDKGRYYYERHLTYSGLRQLVRAFELEDYTRRLIDEPDRYGTQYLVGDGLLKPLFIRNFAKIAYWAFPGYIWVLKKKAS